jgi:gamma-glutamyltranspeptidase/glutathione hydrolase
MSLKPRDAPTLHELPFPSRRSAVMGTGAMVATSQPLAAQTGLEVMRSGGNAVDAAVATAAMLAVVEPTGTGPGGDCFALLYLADEGRVRALNGSGRAPSAMSPATLADRGLQEMPVRGGLTVTVPGTVHGWQALLDGHGRLTLGEVLAAAIDTARRGYPVSELVAAAWQRSEALLAGHPAAARHFLPDGRAPRAGQVVRLPALARTLEQIAGGGAEAFYRGPLATAVVDAVREAGGVLTAEDMAAHRSEWVTPISAPFRGIDVWECPPNGQGLAALLALTLVDGFDLQRLEWGSVDALHLHVEAMRLALADAHQLVADPAFASLPLAILLSDAYADRRRERLGLDRAAGAVTPGHNGPAGNDTVYVAVVDAQGNACSFISSNYMGFGSGIVAGDTGIALQNRGAGFVLTPDHPNRLAPSKRPFHTIMPGLATRPAGSLLAVFGVMGGHMQPQGHLQVLSNLLAYDMDPQRALDAPRFQLLPDGRLALEPWFGDTTRAGLAGRGHVLVPRSETPSAGTFGGGQLIALDEDGVRIGGSDPRKDGQVAAT